MCAKLCEMQRTGKAKTRHKNERNTQSPCAHIRNVLFYPFTETTINSLIGSTFLLEHMQCVVVTLGPSMWSSPIHGSQATAEQVPDKVAVAMATSTSKAAKKEMAALLPASSVHLVHAGGDVIHMRVRIVCSERLPDGAT